MQARIFDNIVVSVPEPRIYSRLGYAKNKTKISASAKDKIDNLINKGISLLALKGSAVIADIESVNGGKVVISQDIYFESKSLSSLLSGCTQILLMGVTAGKDIIDAIHASSKTKLQAAVVFDAVASEYTDTGLDWITDYFRYQIRRQNKEFTSRRFSAGYGDFALEHQKTIYQLLNMHKLGVRLTDSYILVPEKSVTAVIGILIRDTSGLNP